MENLNVIYNVGVTLILGYFMQKLKYLESKAVNSVERDTVEKIAEDKAKIVSEHTRILDRRMERIEDKLDKIMEKL